MKRICSWALTIILIMILTVSSYAKPVIDGKDNGIEWQDSKTVVIVDKKSGNNVHTATLKYRIENEYEISFCLFLSDSDSESLENAGFIITLSDDFTATVTMNSVETEGNVNNYYIDAKINPFNDNTVICEATIGIKRGLPDKISGSVSFRDGNGSDSYYFPFMIENYTATVSETTAEIKTEKPEPTATEKQKTTRKEIKTTKKDISKDKTTKKHTESATTKTKAPSKNTGKDKVYFYEKEIIISQVYVTQPTDAPTEESTTMPYEESTTALYEGRNLTTGMIMWRVICVVGVLVLIGFATWACMEVRKKSK